MGDKTPEPEREGNLELTSTLMGIAIQRYSIFPPIGLGVKGGAIRFQV